MLNVLRDNVRRLAPLLWLVIAAFVILMFWEVGNTTPGNASAQTAATVAGENITFGEFESTYRNLENRFRSVYGESYTPELAEQLGLPMQAIQSLVQQKLLAREAQRVGIEASKPEVRDAIFQVPALQDANGNFIGSEEYQRILAINRIRPEEFEKDLAEGVLLDKFRRFFGSSVWVSSADAERAARADAETAEIRYLLLDPSGYQADLAISEEEVAEYFAANDEQFVTPEKRRVAYLHVNTNVIRAELEIPEEELRDYYQANQDEFTQQEQVRARHILLFVTPERSAEQARAELQQLRERIEAGEDFAALAREFSEDEATAERGGDLGFFPRGQMTADFEQAAFGAQAGELVGPIQNQLGPRTGFHLIEVQDRREGGLQSFEEVENRIRVRLLNERAREQAETKAREVATAAAGQSYDTQDDLQRIADEQGVALQVLEPFAVDETIPAIGRGTPFARTAFDLEPGTVSEPVRIASGWAVLALLDVEESRVPELDEVRTEVRQQLEAERREAAAKERLEELRAAIAAGDQSLDQAAEDLGVTITESGEFDRRGSIAGLGIVPEVNRAALALEQGDIGGPVELDRGLVLFEITQRQHFDPETFAEQREDTVAQLSEERANALLQAVIEARRNEANVTYSQQFIQNFDLDAGPDT